MIRQTIVSKLLIVYTFYAIRNKWKSWWALDTNAATVWLALWGITKVSLLLGDGSTRIVDTKTFYEAFKQQLENKSDELVIQYDNEEIRIENKIIYGMENDSEE